MWNPPALTAADVQRHMDAVIEVVSPSSISSHVKADVLWLLGYLRDQEVLRRVKEEARRPKEEPWDGNSK